MAGSRYIPRFATTHARMPQHVKMPLELVDKVATNMDKKFNANKAYYYNNIANPIASLQVNPYEQDEAIKNGVMDDIDSSVGDMVADDKFLHMENKLLNLSKDLLSHEGLKAIIGNKQKRDATIAEVQAQEGWSADEKQMWLQMIENEQDHSVSYDKATNKARGGWKGYALPEYADFAEKQKFYFDIAKEFRANSNSVEYIAGNYGESVSATINGRTTTLSEYVMTKKQSVEGISPEDITNFLFNSFMSDPELNRTMDAKARMKAFNLAIERDIDNKPVLGKDGKYKMKDLSVEDVRGFITPSLSDIAKHIGTDISVLFAVNPTAEMKAKSKHVLGFLKAEYGITSKEELLNNKEILNITKDKMVGELTSDDITLSTLSAVMSYYDKKNLYTTTATTLGNGLGYTKMEQSIDLHSRSGFGDALKREWEEEDKLSSYNTYVFNAGTASYTPADMMTNQASLSKEYDTLFSRNNAFKTKVEDLKSQILVEKDPEKRAILEYDLADITDQMEGNDQRMKQITDSRNGNMLATQTTFQQIKEAGAIDYSNRQVDLKATDNFFTRLQTLTNGRVQDRTLKHSYQINADNLTRDFMGSSDAAELMNDTFKEVAVEGTGSYADFEKAIIGKVSDNSTINIGMSKDDVDFVMALRTMYRQGGESRENVKGLLKEYYNNASLATVNNSADKYKSITGSEPSLNSMNLQGLHSDNPVFNEWVGITHQRLANGTAKGRITSAEGDITKNLALDTPIIGNKDWNQLLKDFKPTQTDRENNGISSYTVTPLVSVTGMNGQKPNEQSYMISFTGTSGEPLGNVTIALEDDNTLVTNALQGMATASRVQASKGINVATNEQFIGVAAAKMSNEIPITLQSKNVGIISNTSGALTQGDLSLAAMDMERGQSIMYYANFYGSELPLELKRNTDGSFSIKAYEVKAGAGKTALNFQQPLFETVRPGATEIEKLLSGTTKFATPANALGALYLSIPETNNYLFSNMVGIKTSTSRRSTKSQDDGSRK